MAVSEPEANDGEIREKDVHSEESGTLDKSEIAFEAKSKRETPDDSGINLVVAFSEPEANDGEIKEKAVHSEESGTLDKSERTFEAKSKRDKTRETPDNSGIKQVRDDGGYDIKKMLKDEREESWSRVLLQLNLTVRDAIPPCQALIAKAQSEKSQERRRTREALEAKRIRSEMGTDTWETETNTAVSFKAQRIFEALSERYLVQWDGTHILVAKQVYIRSPYNVDCVVGGPKGLNRDVKEKLNDLETKEESKNQS